jgi:Fic family protein
MRKENIRPYTLKQIIEQADSIQNLHQLEENKRYSRLNTTRKILRILDNSETGLRKHDIGNKIIMNPSTLSTALTSLAKGGILKEVQNDDERIDYQHKGRIAVTISGKRYFMTKKGKEARNYIENKFG